MESTNHKRLQALKDSGTDRIFEAYRWFQQHRHELNKEAYGPVLLEVHPAKAHTRAYICCFCLLCSHFFLLLLPSFGLKYQVNISDQLHAAYLEGQVSPYTWKVCFKYYKLEFF